MWTATPFFKLLQNREEFGKVFNIWIVLLLHTNPMVYHTHRSDKRLKSLTHYEIRKTKIELLRFFRLEIPPKP